MLRSMRVRLMFAFVAVVAVAVGIAEVVAERMATREFDSYVSRVDAAYLETLAQNLGNYYAENGSWQNVEPVFLTLPHAPGHLQLQDGSGGIVADTSPGRGPGGPGGPGGLPGGLVGTPSAPGPGGPAGPGDPGGNELAPGGGSPRSSDETGLGERAEDMVLAEPPMALSAALAAQATPTPQAEQRIPVYANGQQVGTLVVLPQRDVLPMSASLGDRFFDRVRLALLVGGITALAVAFLCALFLVDGITRPLRRLADAARRVAAGDFSQRVHVTSPSEAAELAGSFNRMAEALERDQETRHRLLADISHELRTPLSVIQGTAQGFVDGVIPPDQEHAAVIRDQAVLLSKLITDLRDLSLAEAGELRLEAKPSDLGELARQAAAAAQHRAREQGIELEVAASTSVPACLIDGARTLQIIGNLLDNALRHTPSGGRVTLRVRQAEGGTTAVEVEDTGEGIPPEHLPHIFERFYRVDASRARSGGTGLGLAIVSQLARAQGGSVSVESEPGRGSLFRVTLPAVSAGYGAPQDPATRQGRPAATSGSR